MVFAWWLCKKGRRAHEPRAPVSRASSSRSERVVASVEAVAVAERDVFARRTSDEREGHLVAVLVQGEDGAVLEADE